jgi:7-carboxy-7-deazaguanine synthase
MLNVHEVFRSISGEVGEIPQGSIAWFIRFQGCNLRCSWCDTERAQIIDQPGTEIGLTTAGLLANIIPANSNVILTGGEPYCQNLSELCDLVAFLRGKNCTVQVETNGSFPAVLPAFHVMDYKTPSSGMTARMMEAKEFVALPPGSWVKMVVKTYADVEAAMRVADHLIREGCAARIAFSAETGEMISTTIDAITTNAPQLLPHNVFNVQLHKKLNLA